MPLFDWLSLWYSALSDQTKDMLKASLGPTIAILLFVLTNLVSILFGWFEKKRETRHMVKGIYREIAENLKYSQKFLQQVSVIQNIKDRIRKDEAEAVSNGKPPIYRPLIVITESSSFYEAVSGSLPAIKARSLISISAYYRSVMDQRLTAQSIESYAFLHITADSRCETIDDLWKTFEESCDHGQQALRMIERCYPFDWFRVFKP